MPATKPIAPIAAICVLTLLAAGCGGDTGGSASPQPTEPQSSAPQSSAPQPSSQGSPGASPTAANDAGTDAAAPADQAEGGQGTYYGQPAPPVAADENPQAQWKDQRDASDDAAPAN